MFYEDTFIPVSRPTPPINDTPFVELSSAYVLLPPQEPLIIQRPTVPEAPVVAPVYAPTPDYNPIQPLAYGDIVIGGENVAQPIPGPYTVPDPINNVTPLPPLTTYAGVTPIYASKSDIQSPALWSLYPAISTIQGNGYDLIDINSGSISTLYASTVTTTQIDIDGQTLNADNDQLFLNGVPIATTADLSTIQDWSIYPAFSTIVCENTDIIGVRNISSLQGSFSSITANAIQCGVVSSLQVQTSTITANTSLIQESFVSTLGADTVTTDRVEALQIQTSSITANYVSSLYSRASTIGAYDYQVINGTNIGNITTDASATTLFYNGVALASGSSVGSNWYLYPAQTAVDFNSQLLSSVTAIQVPNSGAGGPDLTITTGGAGSGFLRVVGNADIGGSLTTDSFITQNHISASGNNFFGNTVIIGDGGIAGIPADLEINGSDLLGAPSALVVNGGTTLDGGTYHGASIGCLPVAGINTNRIDVLPAGIDVVSATFLTMDILGATNLVAGGAVAIGAGSYVTLEHGAGLGSNGIYVQNSARNSNAKMIFEFGGDISGALFNNQTVREVNAGSLAVGRSAGALTPGIGALAVGVGAGANSLATNATAIGYLTMNTGSEEGSVALGHQAGYDALGANSIAIGTRASFAGGSLASTIVMNATGSALNPVNENALYVAPIRPMATSNILCYDTATKEVSYTNTLSTLSVSSLTAYTIATTFLNDLTIAKDALANIKVGDAFTGEFPAGVYAIAIGGSAGGGAIGQGDNAIAIGNTAGLDTQGIDAIAIGTSSGGASQGDGCVAIGYDAGANTQGVNSVAIGTYAGSATQQSSAVAIGESAGYTTQGTRAVAIGREAGSSTQGINAVAVGWRAGNLNQGLNATAVGRDAGQTTQGVGACAFGIGAGNASQGLGSVAIGENAGLANLGSNSIAIGRFATTVGGSLTQTIVLNATGVALSPAQASSLYVKPVRAVQTSNAYQMSPMLYNITTSEVTYGTSFFTAGRVTAPSSVALTSVLRGRVYIATSAGAQTLTFTNTLTANDVGFYVIVANGNATGGGDITISGATGNTTVHNKTATTNGGQVHLYWTGSALQAF